MAKSVAVIVIVGIIAVSVVSSIIIVGVPPVIVVQLTSIGRATVVVQLTIVVGTVVGGCSDLGPESISSGTVVGRNVTPFVCDAIVEVCGDVAFRLSGVCNEGLDHGVEMVGTNFASGGFIHMDTCNHHHCCMKLRGEVTAVVG